MNQPAFSVHARVFLVHLLILISLVISSCASGTTTPGTGTTPGGVPSTEAPTEPPTQPATEVPTTEVPETEPPVTEEPVPPTDPAGEEIVLMFVYPVMPNSAEEQEFISNAVVQFQEEHPNISVELQFDDSADYLERLQAQAAAGNPPDVAKLRYYDLLQLHDQEALQALDELGFSGEEFLTDALESALFDGQHYGVPQRRDSCALAYSYLSVFSGSKYPQEAFLLADFLTQTAQQEQAYRLLQWYPTKEPLYAELGLECESNEAIRPPKEVLEAVYEQVPERAKALEVLLEGATVLPREGTGVFENEEIVGFGAPVMPVLEPGEPVAGLLSSEEAQTELEDGLVMGVLFINDVPEYPAGDYVIKCFPDRCVLVSPVSVPGGTPMPDGTTEIPFDLVLSEDLEVPVEVPHMAIVPGSRIVCTWVLFWKRCTRVG